MNLLTTSLEFLKKSTPDILKAPKFNNNKDIIKLKVNPESKYLVSCVFRMVKVGSELDLELDLPCQCAVNAMIPY